MISDNENKLEILLDFLKAKIEELPDKINNDEFITKLDNLLDLKIGKDEIQKLKTFIEFCYNKMRNLKDSKNTELAFYDNYSANLVLNINSLEKKVKILTEKIKQLEGENEENVKIFQEKIESLEKSNETERMKLHKNAEELKKKIKSLEESNELEKIKSQKNSEELEKKIKNLEESNELEKIKLQKNAEELEKKIKSLEDSNELEKIKSQKNAEELHNNIEELMETVKSLKASNELEKNNNDKKNEEFQKKVLKLQKENDENKEMNKKLQMIIESYATQIYELNQNIEEIKEEKKYINERDNYNAIVYIILITAGYSFENIWKNIKEITKGSKININKKLINLFYDSQQIYLSSSLDAHNSSNYKIIKKLFPKIDNDLEKFFSDKLLNETKEIIRGMKVYLYNKEKDINFKKKMNDITENVKKSKNLLLGKED